MPPLGCARPGCAATGTFVCKGCCAARYCGRECQAAHREAHRAWCALPMEEAKLAIVSVMALPDRSAWSARVYDDPVVPQYDAPFTQRKARALKRAIAGRRAQEVLGLLETKPMIDAFARDPATDLAWLLSETCLLHVVLVFPSSRRILVDRGILQTLLRATLHDYEHEHLGTWAVVTRLAPLAQALVSDARIAEALSCVLTHCEDYDREANALFENLILYGGEQGKGLVRESGYLDFCMSYVEYYHDNGVVPEDVMHMMCTLVVSYPNTSWAKRALALMLTSSENRPITNVAILSAVQHRFARVGWSAVDCRRFRPVLRAWLERTTDGVVALDGTVVAFIVATMPLLANEWLHDAATFRLRSSLYIAITAGMLVAHKKMVNAHPTVVQVIPSEDDEVVHRELRALGWKVELNLKPAT